MHASCFATEGKPMNAWQLAQQLVRIDSSNPGAQEDTIERYIKLLVEQHVSSTPACLVKHISIKELEVFPARRTLNVTVAGYGSAPNLVYICHMDTVTLGEGWSTDTLALGATVRENRLYGRGACDMKGGLACALFRSVLANGRHGAYRHSTRAWVLTHLYRGRGSQHARR